MDSVPRAEITKRVKAWSGGDSAARERLILLVYKELHQLANTRRAAQDWRSSCQGNAAAGGGLLEGANVQ
jgi:hypothetical protein